MNSSDTANAGTSWVWTLWFCACLIPITTGQGIGVNYVFVLSPLLVLLVYGTLKQPPKFVIALTVLFSLILVVASVYQVEWTDQGTRRLVSFGVFLSVFVFCVLDITSRMVKSFLLALVIVSLFLCCRALVTYVVLGPESLGWGAKDAVGTQRIGFIYLLALWVIVYWPGTKTLAASAVIKPAAISLIVIGLFLTFSRSSIVALAASVVANMLYSAVAKRNGVLTVLAYVVVSAALLAAAVALLTRYFPILVDFYNQRLLDFFLSGALVDALGQSDTSEGSRLEIWRTILTYVSGNLFTGSGFLGVWVIYDAAGSAHNQFMDTILRLGVIGSLAYFAMLFAVGRHLYRSHPGLFVGFMGVLAYGLFHETFKESQGAFVLAFLVGLYGTHLRRMRRAAPSANEPADTALVERIAAQH